MTRFGKELIESMTQAVKYAAGKKVRGLHVSRPSRVKSKRVKRIEPNGSAQRAAR